MTDPVPAPTLRPVVFYSPHQDDETLFMGQVITHHALVGREVHVVLCSNGSTSSALGEINGTVGDATFWGGSHYPAREGYPVMTKADFGLHRTDEFVAACGQLGVPRERVHFGRADVTYGDSSELPDAVSPTWATEVMQSWADHFAAGGDPAVGHYTMWWMDPHYDHASLGQALHALHLADPTTFSDARWAVKPEQAAAAGALPYGLPSDKADLIKWMGRHAGWCYRAWLPPLAYAIGYHSVGSTYFDDTERGDPNHVVRLVP